MAFHLGALFRSKTQFRCTTWKFGPYQSILFAKLYRSSKGVIGRSKAGTWLCDRVQKAKIKSNFEGSSSLGIQVGEREASIWS